MLQSRFSLKPISRLMPRVLGFFALLFLNLMLFSQPALALTGTEKVGLVQGESDQRLQVLDQVVARGDLAAVQYLQQLLDDAVRTDGDKVLIVTDAGAINALTGKADTLSEAATEVINNNRIQSELQASIAALKLLSKNPMSG